MSANKVFFDTNVLFYAYDGGAPEKQAIAQSLLEEGLTQHNGLISVQVLGEFFHATVIRRGILTTEEGRSAVAALSALEIASLDATLVKAAIAIHARFQLRYWDSLILATAKRHLCGTVYSEDFSHHQNYDGVRVINPFA